jgi:hypothetical protein
MKARAIGSAALIVGLVLTGAASAMTTLYQCNFTQDPFPFGSDNWVAPTIRLTHDSATGEVVVSDAIIDRFVGGPIKGRFERDSGDIIQFRWSLRVRSRGTRAKMNYDLTWYRNQQRAEVFAKPAGFDNQFSKSGTCTLNRL